MKKDIISKRLNTIYKVTLIGSIVNLILSLGKIVAGIAGKSSAMLADGIHSLSDLLTDVIVIIFVKISGKKRDQNHHYGHGKYETFATMLIGFALALVGVGIFWAGITRISEAISGTIIKQPGLIALYAAIISIVAKETLFWYTKTTGKKVNSSAMIANAWHHRSDSYSSVGTALGISGAIFLGEKWRILDPLAGIIVSFFILKIAWETILPNVKELLESSLPFEIEADISDIIKNTNGVLGFHNLKTRKIGETIAIDVHIKVNKLLSVENSHKIATEIEKRIIKRFGENAHIGIHVEPFGGLN